MTYIPPTHKKIFHNLRRIAAQIWINILQPYQVAITGSQGKTSTTKVITTILSSLGPTVVTDTNLDTNFNVPITALKVRPDTRYVVWELGIDHPGEMDRHLEIAHPHISIVTGISPVHTDKEHMGSLETLIAEKRKIIEKLRTDDFALLNYDNEYVRGMASHTKAKVLWYGANEQCDIWVDPTAIEVTLDGTKAYFHTKEETFAAQTKLIGTYHVYNLMAGYLVMREVLKKNKIATEFAKVITEITPLKGRMSVDQGPLQTILLNDSLRANPESTNAGLETLARIQYSKGRKIAVIGEMGELEHPEEEHTKTGITLAKMLPDFVVCIGPLRKYTVDEAIKRGYPSNQIFYVKDVFEAANVLKNLLKPGDLWYLKGSLLRNYKRIVQLLNGEKVCCNAVLCPYEHCGYKE